MNARYSTPGHTTRLTYWLFAVIFILLAAQNLAFQSSFVDGSIRLFWMVSLRSPASAAVTLHPAIKPKAVPVPVPATGLATHLATATPAPKSFSPAPTPQPVPTAPIRY